MLDFRQRTLVHEFAVRNNSNSLLPLTSVMQA